MEPDQQLRRASALTETSVSSSSLQLRVPTANLPRLHSHTASTDESTLGSQLEFGYHLQSSASPEPSVNDLTPLPYRADGTPRRRPVVTPRKPPALVLPSEDELLDVVHASVNDEGRVQQPSTARAGEKLPGESEFRWWQKPRRVLLLVIATASVVTGVAAAVIYFLLFRKSASPSTVPNLSTIIPLHTTAIAQLVRLETADPSILVVDGVYYLTRIGSHNNIEMMSGTTLAEVQSAQPVTVYQASQSYTYDAVHGCALPISQMWAPELNFVFGAYHIYFTASPVKGVDWHRLYVLRSTISDQPDAPYQFFGQLVTDHLIAYNAATRMPAGSWAIDPSTFVTPSDNQTWLLYSGDIFGNGDNSGGNQKVYLLPLKDATTVLDSAMPPTLLTQPELPWETNFNQPFFWINEGPSAYVHQDRLYVTYAASFCSTPFYSIGAVWIDLPATGSTLATLRQSPYTTEIYDNAHHMYRPSQSNTSPSWRKLPVPLISANTSSGMYGIGGGQWYEDRSTVDNSVLAYYSFHYTTSSTGSCGAGRHTATVQMHFDDVRADGRAAEQQGKLTVSS